MSSAGDNAGVRRVEGRFKRFSVVCASEFGSLKWRRLDRSDVGRFMEFARVWFNASSTGDLVVEGAVAAGVVVVVWWFGIDRLDG